jgi:ubiquinone/menaquinone biosynthesis C-methylase UbiE
MNENHAKLCPSPEWAAWLQGDILPVLAAQADLGEEMLEIGPGPGAATGWLADRVKRLVALEADEQAAAALAAKYPDVEVLTGDATAMSFPDGSFDSAGSFTMLHHVPMAAAQDRLLAEVLRVLRPGGLLIGSDSLGSNDLHHFHVGDVYNPVEPAALLTRLRTLGFGKVIIGVDDVVTFVAHKPAPGKECGS